MTRSSQFSATHRTRRVALVLAGAVGFAILVSWGHATPAEPTDALWRVLARLRTAALTMALPAAALALGHGVLRPMRRRWGPPGEPSLALALALGWGAMSLLGVAAALGMRAMRAVGLAAPVSGQWSLAPLLVFVCLAPPLRAWARGEASPLLDALAARRRSLWHKSPGPLAWAGVAIVALVMLRQVAAALTPSLSYDVLEYHLPQVRWTLAGHGLEALPLNAYSQMPQGAEMLFLWGRLLEGAAGEIAPKVVHVLLGWTSVLLLNALLRELRVVRSLRALAALVCLSHPVWFVLSSEAFVGLASAMYATAALLCWVRAMRLPNRLDLLLAAAFMGLACSTKYPVIGIAAVPFFFILAPLGAPRCLAAPLSPGLSGKRILASVALMSAVAAAVYSPWLARAIVYERTPFPPLTPSLADSGDAYARGLQAFMAASHRPRDAISLTAALRLSRRADAAGILLLSIAVVYLLWPRGVDERRRGLAAYAVLGYAIWNTSPHAPARYLAPLVPALAALGCLAASDLGRARGRVARLAVAATLAAWALWHTGFQTLDIHRAGWLQGGIGGESTQAFRVRSLGLTGRFFAAIEAQARRHRQSAGAGSPFRVLMLYEARAAALPPDTSHICNTVFDKCPLWEIMHDPRCDDPRAAARLVGQATGCTHIAVNEIELSRQIATFPVRAALDTKDWREAMKQEAAAGFRPALLRLWWYYAPFYYYGYPALWRHRAEEAAAAWRRLDGLVDYLGARACWRRDYRGARVFVAGLGPSEATK